MPQSRHHRGRGLLGEPRERATPGHATRHHQDRSPGYKILESVTSSLKSAVSYVTPSVKSAPSAPPTAPPPKQKHFSCSRRFKKEVVCCHARLAAASRKSLRNQAAFMQRPGLVQVVTLREPVSQLVSMFHYNQHKLNLKYATGHPSAHNLHLCVRATCGNSCTC